MDGIGHPSMVPGTQQPRGPQPGSVPFPTTSYTVAITSGLVESDTHPLDRGQDGPLPSTSGRVQDDGLAILLNSPHWQGRTKQMPLFMRGSAAAAADSVLAEASALEAASAGLDQKKAASLATGRGVQAAGPPPLPPSSQPFEDDLKLWNGKRLNETERKVEQRLHVLRNNPTAKTDLKQKVASYVSELKMEHADRVARAEFAAERREQKVSPIEHPEDVVHTLHTLHTLHTCVQTLEFVQQRFKSSRGKDLLGAAADAPTALFDSKTGKARQVQPVIQTEWGENALCSSYLVSSTL